MSLTKIPSQMTDFTAPTIQKFTSGSGTYTTPPNCKYILVSMVGGGGGGCRSDSSNAAGAGGNTTFGTMIAYGGSAGSTTDGVIPSGGSFDLSTYSGLGVAGGDAGSRDVSINYGSSGGSSWLGGAGGMGETPQTSGNPGKANTGGGGGGCARGGTLGGGSGGGAGGGKRCCSRQGCLPLRYLRSGICVRWSRSCYRRCRIRLPGLLQSPQGDYQRPYNASRRYCKAWRR